MEPVIHGLKEQGRVFMERNGRSLPHLTVHTLYSLLISVLCNLNLFSVPHFCLSFLLGG